MSSFVAIQKKADGSMPTQELPFNPLSDGWEYVGACCCEIGFKKGDVKIKIAVPHNQVRVLRLKGEKKKLESVFTLPKNQLEFLIKSNNINAGNITTTN